MTKPLFIPAHPKYKNRTTRKLTKKQKEQLFSELMRGLAETRWGNTTDEIKAAHMNKMREAKAKKRAAVHKST